MRPDLSFGHLARLTTPLGLFEHALGTVPRVEHGYCVDDVARALVVTARVPDPTPQVQTLADGYLDFLLSALRPNGLLPNRRDVDGTWTDQPMADDHWGRAIWALGTAAAHSPDAALASRARAAASVALRVRSRWPRAMAYAAIGAGELLAHDAHDPAAVRLLVDARTVLARPRPDPAWPWPEDRLTYANAVLPQAMITVGSVIADDTLTADGLSLLGWLVDQQTHDGHLSVVPSSGRARGDARPGYAQQPIEVSALAEACRTAFLATRDSRWTAVIDRCVAWFLGANDAGLVLCDVATGGGFDGLERGSVSINQGAESTLAWLATAQVARMPVLAVAR